tara:strand:+ start:6827 stop:7465 length:639 start_codon:yes stop_codon:yes gene_type:complete
MGLNNTVERLTSYRAKKSLSRLWVKRSAVAIVIDQANTEQASVLLIKRAENERDPWSGHMAFPGGRYEPVDKNGLATAKREMHEEVGFDIDKLAFDSAVSGGNDGQCIARLSDIKTSKRATPSTMVVTPYIFSVLNKPALMANHEVADTVWVPLSFFSALQNRSIYELNYNERRIEMPCYRYEGNVIWGITLSMIDEMLRALGVNIPQWYRT